MKEALLFCKNLWGAMDPRTLRRRPWIRKKGEGVCLPAKKGNWTEILREIANVMDKVREITDIYTKCENVIAKEVEKIFVG